MNIQYRTIAIKPLTRKKRRGAGRNSTGRVVSYHRGGGSQLRYRLVDTRRRLLDVPAVFLRYEIDPNRTALLALICYKNGFLSYILGADALKAANFIVSAVDAPSSVGNHVMLANVVVGSYIHNIELAPRQGGTFVRAGGCFGQLLRKRKNRAFVKLASGEVRILSIMCFATLGTLLSRGKRCKSKAGHSRWLGIRPTVRGVAMNPVDHPMGGGEGKTSGGRPSVSPWGILTKSAWKTRKKSKKAKHVVRVRSLNLE